MYGLFINVVGSAHNQNPNGVGRFLHRKFFIAIPGEFVCWYPVYGHVGRTNSRYGCGVIEAFRFAPARISGVRPR